MKATAKAWLGVAFFLALQIAATFPEVIFQGKTLLPMDHHLSLYLPYAETYTPYKPHNHFEDDILRWYIGYRRGAQEHLYQPYWNPHQSGGLALYANPYATHFSSTNWVLKLGSIEQMYSLQIMLQLWIAGLTMAFFARTLGLSFRSALFAGSAYMLCAMFSTLLLRGWWVGGFAWVPLLFAFGHRKNFWGAALALALCFTDGFIQSSMAIALIFSIYVSVLQYFKDKRIVSSVFWIIGVGLIAFLLSAIMWFPILEYLQQDLLDGSTRMSGSYYHKTFWQRLLSIPLLIAGFFGPEWLGSVRSFDVTKAISTHLQDFAPFFGILPAILVFQGFVESLKNKTASATEKTLQILFVVGCLVPLTPLDRYFYFRFLMVAVFAGTILAAIQLEAFLENPRVVFRKLKTVFGIKIFAAILSTALILLNYSKLSDILRQMVRDRLSQSPIALRQPEWMGQRVDTFLSQFQIHSAHLAVPLLGLLALLIWIYCRPRLSVRWFFFGIIFLQWLPSAHFAREWHAFSRFSERPFFPANYLTEFLKGQTGREFRVNVDDVNSMQPDRAPLQILPTNSFTQYRVDALEGFDGMVPPVVYDLNGDRKDYRRLGLLNVEYILTHSDVPLMDACLKKVLDQKVAIYQNICVQPRARLVGAFQIAPFKETYEKLRKESLPENEVILENTPGWVSNKVIFTGDVSLDEKNANRKRYQVNSSRAALLLISDSWYPGWKAKVLGQETPVLRANAVMQGVTVPAGKSTVELYFEPLSYRIGKWITLITAALWLLGFAMSRYRLRGHHI